MTQVFILIFIIGLIFGHIMTDIFYLLKPHGVIQINEKDKSCFFKMSSKDIENIKNKTIIFDIERTDNSQK